MSFWVFLGQVREQRLATSSFDLAGRPVPGVLDVIETRSQTNARDEEPKFDELKREWLLGRTIGTLRAGDRVRVKQIYSINSSDPRMLWAEVTVYE